jgi:hypothetical protein
LPDTPPENAARQPARMSEQNLVGDWVPAIPLPMFVGPFKRCRCGARRLRMRRYREHYIYTHIHQGVPT